MSSIDNTKKIVVPAEREIATVSAWPDEVQVVIHAPEGNLTIEQAKELATNLVAAAELAARLDWKDDGNGDTVPILVERQHA